MPLCCVSKGGYSRECSAMPPTPAPAPTSLGRSEQRGLGSGNLHRPRMGAPHYRREGPAGPGEGGGRKPEKGEGLGCRKPFPQKVALQALESRPPCPRHRICGKRLPGRYFTSRGCSSPPSPAREVAGGERGNPGEDGKAPAREPGLAPNPAQAAEVWKLPASREGEGSPLHPPPSLFVDGMSQSL